MSYTKRFALITICIIFSSAGSAQRPKISWQHCFGGSNLEGLYPFNSPDSTHNLFIGGTSSNDGNVFGNHGGNCGFPCNDAWLVSVDIAGDLLWQKCLGGSGDDLFKGGIRLENGNFLFCGETTSNDGDVSGNHSPGSYDGWVVETDSNGLVLWQQCYGGSDVDQFVDLKPTNDKGFVLAGHTRSNDGDVSGYHTSCTFCGEGDIWIVKLDSSRNIQWQKCIGGSDTDSPYSIFNTSDNGFLVSGLSYSNDFDVSAPYGLCDYYIVKLDSLGNKQWDKSYGGTFNDYPGPKGTCKLGNNQYVITGRTESDDGLVSGNHNSGGGVGDVWTIRIDSIGSVIWQKCYGGIRDDWGISIVVDTDGGLFITGNTNSDDGDVSSNHYGGIGCMPYPCDDIWAFKIDQFANLIWEKCFGGSDGEASYGCKLSVDSGYFISGYAHSSIDGDLIGGGNHGGDAWVIKLNHFSIDAALQLILFPNLSYLCDSVFTPEILVKNNSDSLLTYLEIKYQIDTGTIQNFIWTGNLLPDSNQQISLPLAAAASGNHIIKIYLANPNGTIDENPYNDTLIQSFTIDQNFSAIPFEEGFQETIFPPDNFQFIDPFGLFYHLTSAGGFGNSDSCLRVRFFVSSGYEFVSFAIHEIDFTNAIPPIYLSFSLASAMKNSNSLQSLEIYASSDCANSWNQVYLKTDMLLSTTGFRTNNFNPLASDWRSEIIDLSAYAGFSHVRINYQAEGQGTNNLHIDDINIHDATGSVYDFSSMHLNLFCYYNSSTSNIDLTFQANSNSNLQLSLFDLTGKLLLQHDWKITSGINTSSIKAVGIAKGIYILKLIDAANVISSKLIVE